MQEETTEGIQQGDVLQRIQRVSFIAGAIGRVDGASYSGVSQAHSGVIEQPRPSSA